MSKYKFDPKIYQQELIEIAKELALSESLSKKYIDRVIKKHPQDGNKVFSRDKLILGLKWLWKNGLVDFDQAKLKHIIKCLKLKPTRSISGVTTVTVLTKPFACPGKCIFCPNDVRMPKSYIATEPGAQRALMNRFSPYLQVWNRLKALQNIGHPTDKIELLVLGGTWSYYPEKYKVWFIEECFRAMNDFGKNLKNTSDKIIEIKEYLQNDYNDELRKETGDKPYNQLIQTPQFKNHFKKFLSPEPNLELDILWKKLEEEQVKNSKGKVRCVGLVLETRPDCITPQETLRLRKLGATKIQLGIQTLDDKISELNKRGETKKDTINAFKLLRSAGFKIHAHIMPNLYGSNPKTDLKVYKELFSSPNFRPDEIKIYPASIIKHTELEKLYKEGKYKPYSTNELVDLVAKCIEVTPEYCRITRVIRDIPSTEITSGNKTTNLREVAEDKLKREDRPNRNIRAREIKNQKINLKELKLDQIKYETINSLEYFLQFITNDRKIAGFLRLSVPKQFKNPITSELDDCAIIREIHVYGPSLGINTKSFGEAQHLGLGTKLIKRAEEIAKKYNFPKLAVISSIGTREYYKKRGFELIKLYQIKELF
ncbi:MAG: tRNA uridine(34) 5-carboxymethylaminomethyl modification radical SAM/GNAT enzyme Elp3 [Candidatus Dojkabacteria bacterium]|nr:MAG: tRNA uridine(34) 5-carboxymethylaminomethyl modification radical SAM/GNAT enzyme Elp3 [Candidatus Dojkabacteria bacterium]